MELGSPVEFTSGSPAAHGRSIESGPRRSHEIPLVSGDIEEHDNTAIGLVARFRDELDAMDEHPLTRRLEVVDTKEQADSSCVLPTDRIELPLAVRLSEKESGLGLRRPHDHPP